MNVFLTTVFKQQLSIASLHPADFIVEFTHAINDPDNVWEFGKNVKSPNPSDLWHIHLVPPVGDPKYAAWEANWNIFADAIKRTSDNLCFYTKDDDDYLLIFMASPGGHNVMKIPSKMRDMSLIAEQFILRRSIP